MNTVACLVLSVLCSDVVYVMLEYRDCDISIIPLCKLPGYAVERGTERICRID